MNEGDESWEFSMVSENTRIYHMLKPADNLLYTKILFLNT